MSEPGRSAPPDAAGTAELEQEGLARAAEAGVHRLSIPTPFAVGRVNAYLIDDEPLTLVDSGPNSGKALDALERALAEHGRRVEDLGLLVITHQHIDHLGLIEILARRSGADVAALDALAPWAARYPERADADDAFAHALMLRHGIPADVAEALRAVSLAFRGWGSRATITRPLPDGSELRLRDRTLEVLHRPGHSPSDTLFFDRERALLLAGDHLLARISSNPLIALPLDAPLEPDAAARTARQPALSAYLRSLRATRELPARLTLSGHGPPIVDHVPLIDERVRLHARRAERIFALIAEQPRNAHEIAHALWGNVAVTQAYLTLSEVLGHVDLLLEAGRVSEVDADGVVRFVAA